MGRPDRKVSSEITVGVNIGGQEMDIPTLVPTLSSEEISYLLGGGEPTPDIINKAVEHAIQRIQKGLSPFKD